MAKQQQVLGPDADLHQLFAKLLPRNTAIGFDSLVKSVLGDPLKLDYAYPPYNILHTTGEGFRIEVAVSGFNRDEIDITLADSRLKVVGAKKEKIEDSAFLYKGIATRDWQLVFMLADDTLVKSVDLLDGMLLIDIQRIVPDNKKPKKIPIGYLAETSTNNAQLLAEATSIIKSLSPSENPDRAHQFIKDVARSEGNIC
jgi:molecular chaperone IbpA